MKKLLIVLVALGLLISMNVQVMAERRVYAEYEREEGEPDEGPTFGYQWDIDPLWSMALECQLDGAEDNEASVAAEITRRIYVGMTTGLRTELSDSKNSFRLKVKGEQNYSPFQLDESLSYTVNLDLDNSVSDYNELELYFGVANKLSDKWKMSVDTTWTQVRYSNVNKSGSNYEKWKFTPKFRYLLNKQLQLSGGYIWVESATSNKEKDNFIIGAKYLLGNYSYYFEYEFPVDGDAWTIGIEYTF